MFPIATIFSDFLRVRLFQITYFLKKETFATIFKKVDFLLVYLNGTEEETIL